MRNGIYAHMRNGTEKEQKKIEFSVKRGRKKVRCVHVLFLYPFNMYTYRVPRAVNLPLSMCIEYLTDYHWPLD